MTHIWRLRLPEAVNLPEVYAIQRIISASEEFRGGQEAHGMPVVHVGWV